MRLTTGSITQNLNFQGSSITSGGNTNINITNQVYESEAEDNLTEDPYSILEGNTVLDALYNSNARYDPPKCHRDTRKAVLEHIRSWASGEDSQPIMWIRGGAGAGKSAIAQTLSEGWATEDFLAASFYFFRTGSGRNEKKHFIATLAYQMIESIPGYRRLIEGAIRQTPKIFERNLRAQMQMLIIKPLVTLSRSETTIRARLVVIDGLDECCHSYVNQTFEQQQKEILEAIHLASSEKAFPLRFLIASRPERQIREIFDCGILESISMRILLDNTQNPSADIELYVRCSLAEISRIHPHLGPSWPPEDIIEQLVLKSSGHFIYAAVVVRYLRSPRTDPEARLTTLMNIAHSNVDRPFAELDALYTHILESIAPQSLFMVMDIFGLMIYSNVSGTEWTLFDNDTTKMSPYFIAKYLFISPGQLSLHLVDLHSILDIPSNAASKSAPISFLHASFSEFLIQSSRSQRFFIDKERSESRIFKISIRHLLIQLLSDSSEKDEYTNCGFGLQVGGALGRIKPDNDDIEALRAISSQDENDFTQYVHKAKLSHFGTIRRSMRKIRELYWHAAPGLPKRPMVLDALKRHPVHGLVPIDPASDDMHSVRYQRALNWFCDASQETALRSQSHHPSEELSHYLDIHPTGFPAKHGDIHKGLQREPENPQVFQPSRSKRRLGLESRISSFSPKPTKSQRRL